MHLIPESARLDDYLEETDVVDFSHPLIQQTAKELFHNLQSEIDKTKTAFEFVRDHIAHSWDIQSTTVTCHASEVLLHREGICYAKANVLAALLRSQGIPVGFCYQKLMLFDTPDQGYCLHALNAVYFRSLRRWVRLDARGNKPGVQAEFSLDQEKLAFPVQPAYGEQDFPVIYVKPDAGTIKTLQTYKNALEMYRYGLPDRLSTSELSSAPAAANGHAAPI
ncbi:transglutaminase [Geobacillus thermoleovorans]|uniref:Transglutaminase family protein n=1 Tax=Geobacillus proteiniphilus TaxID=860353 RepID=A0ABY9MGX8_9BACL|nr:MULTISPECIES: transglutaminase family protein [Geobacillus]MED0654892.1 transglutaminase family protein [Anoxybacillus geothermalis]QHN49783.1 transglutaminase family protein [Geobacillus stearothermophilus]ODA17825.1 transglutaminase [Geobacillus thermoleovorans]PJW15437.1 transglutaminase family protein [Geobacillus sp. Manikaran-105]PJW18515.1 transglutaminase family protein [Geobacillus sp. WSUCF-018B]